MDEWLLLHKELDYNPDTGIWTWKVNKRSTKKGNRAGSVHASRGDVRRHIGFNRSYYLSSRLAWFYMIGKWPTLEIDHKDRNTLNDKWNNLQELTHAQNCNNRRKRGT
jgi:hypothetical protein